MTKLETLMNEIESRINTSIDDGEGWIDLGADDWQRLKKLCSDETERLKIALEASIHAMESCRCGGYDVGLHKEYNTSDGALEQAREALKRLKIK